MDILVHFSDLSTISIILFLVGIILMIVEMFTPGFGLAGLSGIAILIFDVIYSANSFQQGFWLMLFVMTVVAIFFIVFLYMISHDKLPSKMILKDATSHKSGFSSAADKQQLIAVEGVSVTELRPAGIADLNDQRLDVVSHGDYIERNKRIRVIAVEGNRIIVKEIKEDKS